MRPHCQNVSDHFYIHNWKTFKEVWKSTDFIAKFKEATHQQIRKILMISFQDIIQDQKHLCYLFPDSLKQDIINLITQIIKSNEFKDHLDYDYEALYFGKKKQLLVYKFNQRSLCIYLSKYRLPTKHIELFESVNKDYSSYKNKIIQKNVLISNRASLQQIHKKQEELQEQQKYKFGKSILLYIKYFQTILKDFVNQPKRQQILIQKVNSILRQQIQKLCTNMQLRVSDRFYDDQSFSEIKDILIHKKQYSQPDQSNDSQLDYNSQDSKQQVIAEPQIPKIKAPKNIQAVKVQKFIKQGVKCKIQLKPFGTTNQPQYLKCSVRYPAQISYQKVWPITEDIIKVMYAQIILEPVSNGYTQYKLTTGNQAGQSADMILKLWTELQDAQKKELNMNNKVLYVLGQSKDGLIFDPKQSNQENMIVSTNNQWKKLIGCCDFSVSNHAVICNKDGDCAGWGKMYCFGQDPDVQNEQENQQQDQNAFRFSRPYFFRAQKLSLILSGGFIRKVSCGDSYCLMVNSLGQAYSFGTNNFGQLGLGHVNQTQDTSQPQIIKKLADTFIIDVVATNYGSSYAIDARKKAYRWGLNQMDSSPNPVYDSFSNLVNFQYEQIIMSQHIPLMLTSKMITDPVRQIYGGRDFSLLLTQTNILYGWGNIDYLGIQKLEDTSFNKIKNICIPIQINKNIKKIAVGGSFCIALTNDNQLIGWGQQKIFNKNKITMIKEPQILLKQYNSNLLEAGTNYVIIEHEKGFLQVLGDTHLSQTKHKLPPNTTNVKAGNGVIMALCSASN